MKRSDAKILARFVGHYFHATGAGVRGKLAEDFIRDVSDRPGHQTGDTCYCEACQDGCLQSYGGPPAPQCDEGKVFTPLSQWRHKEAVISTAWALVYSSEKTLADRVQALKAALIAMERRMP